MVSTRRQFLRLERGRSLTWSLPGAEARRRGPRAEGPRAEGLGPRARRLQRGASSVGGLPSLPPARLPPVGACLPSLRMSWTHRRPPHRATLHRRRDRPAGMRNCYCNSLRPRSVSIIKSHLSGFHPVKADLNSLLQDSLDY